MLNDCRESIKFDLKYQKDLLRRLRRRRQQLEHVSNDSLSIKTVNGKHYYVKSKCENGVVTTSYLGKDALAFRREIQEKKYVDKAIQNCEKNISVLSKALSQYCEIHPEIVKESLPKAYQEQENAMDFVFGYEKSSKWRDKKLTEKKQFIDKYGDFMEEKRRQHSSDGVDMASKSELAMNELLLSMKIPFVYDFPRFFGSDIKRPDFLCLNERTGKEYFFEHVGFLANEEYASKFVNKMRVYARAGVIPNVNLLLTYEDMDGNIDLEAARKMLETFLL